MGEMSHWTDDQTSSRETGPSSRFSLPPAKIECLRPPHYGAYVIARPKEVNEAGGSRKHKSLRREKRPSCEIKVHGLGLDFVAPCYGPRVFIANRVCQERPRRHGGMRG